MQKDQHSICGLKHRQEGGTIDMLAIVIGKRIGDLSSKPGWDYWRFTSC